MNCKYCGGYRILIDKDDETTINHTVNHYRCTKCRLEEITDDMVVNIE